MHENARGAMGTVASPGAGRGVGAFKVRFFPPLRVRSTGSIGAGARGRPRTECVKNLFAFEPFPDFLGRHDLLLFFALPSSK